MNPDKIRNVLNILFINWNICSLFDFLCQILSDNLTIKVLTKLVLYFLPGILTLCKLLHLKIPLCHLTEKVKLINSKSYINLK